MKLIIIFGPGSVGKMTVGQELTKITQLKLFHNHMTIELVLELFGTFRTNANGRLRDIIFEEFLKTEQEGLIFTFMWALDYKEEWDLINKYKDMFENQGAEVYFVELEASQDERLKRNVTPNRLAHKKSKQNIELSKQRIINEDTNYRLNTFEGEMPYKNYIKINNEHLKPDEVARKIKETFMI
ncbi:shikimate kinase [Tenericutes bacterium MO-XQ]|nr:shikimate kinase [Tenericutes bacterium MO-XQ]